MQDSIVLPVNPLTLRFAQDQRSIEKEYQSFSFKQNLGHIRTCHYLAILLYALFILVDLQIAPDTIKVHLIIRFALVCPIFCIGLVLSYRSWYQNIYSYLLGFYVLLTANGYLVMGFFAPASFHFVYYIGFIACLIFGYIYIRLPFLFASAIGWIAGFAYFFVQFYYGQHEDKALFSYLAYLLGFEFLLMMVCYSEEKSVRNSFYLFYLLSIERDRTREINTELAEVVEKRTVELHQLADAISRVKKLSGLLPICSSCKKIRDDKGYWNKIESYIQNHSEAEFSHSICPDCIKKLYPDL